MRDLTIAYDKVMSGVIGRTGLTGSYFHGIGIDPTYYAAHIKLGAVTKDSGGAIVINPSAALKWAKEEVAAGRITEQQIPRAIAASLYADAIHEPIHQLLSGHNTDFASRITRAVAQDVISAEDKISELERVINGY